MLAVKHGVEFRAPELQCPSLSINIFAFYEGPVNDLTPAPWERFWGGQSRLEEPGSLKS